MVHLIPQNLHKLVELRTIDDAQIVCTTISPNGEFLLYSTDEAVRLFHLTYEVRTRTIRCLLNFSSNSAFCSFYPNQNNKIGAINRMKDLPEQFTICHKAVFSSDSQSIFMAKTDLTVDVFRLLIGEDTIDIDFETSFDLSKVLKGPIMHFVLSDCGKYLVAADISCNITVWRQNKRNWIHHINLPRYHVSPVSLAIHKHAPKLVAAFADGKLFEYHLEEMKFLCSTTTHFVESHERYPIKNIVPDPKNEDVFVVHNDQDLFVLQKQKVSVLKIEDNFHSI